MDCGGLWWTAVNGSGRRWTVVDGIGHITHLRQQLSQLVEVGPLVRVVLPALEHQIVAVLGARVRLLQALQTGGDGQLPINQLRKQPHQHT